MLVTDVLIDTISPARTASLEILEAVEKGAYASDTLLQRTRSLQSRDAGLASQIVFGCLRYQAQLDHLIFFYSGRKTTQLKRVIVVVLRMGIFQLRYLDRVPAHAVVHDSVGLAKKRCRAAAGFVNAVLRKVNRELVKWPNVATELSCPGWLLDRWTAHFGPDQARAIAEAALEQPAAYIRIPPRSAPPIGLTVEPTEIAGCFRVRSQIPSGVRLQDIGSQSLLPLLGLQEDHTFLDVCAAPGNKTLQALEVQLRLAVACDVSEKRIREISPFCNRVVLDACRPLPFSCKFDRILVDAPCSGTGTLGRNPEIKWRVQAKDFPRFREKQSRILLQSLELLVPGGKLLYATCSLESEENEEVVRGALAVRPDLHCECEVWRLPGRDEGDGFYAAILC